MTDFNESKQFKPIEPPENYLIKFKGKVDQLTDVCLFSSYSFRGVVEDYVYYYLKALKDAGFSIFFISTSELKESCVQKLKELAFIIIERENKCPDFGSWKIALSLLNGGRHLNSVLLANDSVFGPFYDLGRIVASMKRKYDVWGMTDSYEIDYHLQSYFLHVSKNVLLSATWQSFWKTVDLSLTKQAVIDRYEAGLSRILKEANFKIGAYASIDIVSKNSRDGSKLTNISLRFWKMLIEEFDFPFFKREAIIKKDIHKVYWERGLYINVGNWRKLISEKTDYPVALIDNFILNYFAFIKNEREDINLRKRKILFLTHNAEIGGAQYVLLNFLKWLKQNTDIPFETIICRAGKQQLEAEFCRLGNVTHFYSLSDQEKQKFKNYLIDERIALVFSNTSINIEALQFLSFLDVPQIVYAHELTYVLNAFPQVKANEEWLRKNISHFITGSQAVKENLVDYLKIDEDKASVVYEFVNDDYNYSNSRRSKDLRKELNIPDDAFIVGMCGTFEWRKSADLLPVIASTLCSNNASLYVIWIGADPENPLYSQVEFDLVKANLTDRIRLVRKQKDFQPYFQLFDLFLMISREDPFPLVNLESGLAGKPVICFENSGGTTEYVNFGTGASLPYLDLVSLSEKVNSYYKNPVELQSLRETIPGIVKENFTTKKQAPKLLEIIKQHYDITETIIVEEPSITIMTHIFFDNTWDEIKRKIKHFDNGTNHFLFSISEACLIKEEILRDIKETFQNAHAIITSNVGRDIGGKFALIDLYFLLGLKTTYMIFLHDKQSLHTLVGESWKKNLFRILEPGNYWDIIKVFKDKNAGVVGAKEHIINEYDPGTGVFRHNNELSKLLLSKYNISINNYEYISGSIYWMRSSIIEDFFAKNNPLSLRNDLESGNVLDINGNGNTMVHTWERMFCWLATNNKFSVTGV